MKKNIILSLILFILIVVLIATAKPKNLSNNSLKIPDSTVTTVKPTPKFDHIVIIVMENKSTDDIIGSNNAPFINSLLLKGSFLNNYHAVAHPSLPNYLALIGGSTFGISSDCTTCYLNQPNLIDWLETKQKSWKAYMESMPSSCFIGDSGDYAQKHNPFIYFNDIRLNPNRCKNIVPFSQLSADLSKPNTAPNFIWISPNLCHDMHNCSIQTGDTWLSQQIPQILSSKLFINQSSLFILTWDENDSVLTLNNQIPTILIGSGVKQNYKSNIYYTHYSLLHTIESSWNLPTLTNNDQQAQIINDIF